MKRLLIVTALLLLAASDAPRMHLRYHPAPQSRWQTEGTLTVSSWIGWPDGEERATQETDLRWSDVVTQSGPSKILLARTVSRWARRDSGQDLASPTPFVVSVTGLLGLADRDLVEQPEPYPVDDVSPGETWSIRHPVTMEALPLGDKVLVITNQTGGAGRVTRLEAERAVIEVDTTTESRGSGPEVISRSLTRSSWWLEIERAEGVPLVQKIESVTLQTLTVGGVTVPSRLETSIYLRTRRDTPR